MTNQQKLQKFLELKKKIDKEYYERKREIAKKHIEFLKEFFLPVTRQEKFIKIIEKAEKNGWEGDRKMIDGYLDMVNYRHCIAFSFFLDPSFLNAYFLDHPEYGKTTWQYHATQLDLSEDKIEYLYSYL